MDYPQKEQPPIKTQSEFQELLETLRQEASTSTELSSRAYGFVNSIQQIPEPINNEKLDVKDKEPTGVIEMLYAEVWRVRKANQELQRTVDHLEKVIGY